MKHQASISWEKDMTFSTELDGHSFFLDTDKDSGGNDKGPRPKRLLLEALAGCTAMDVVSILKKMRVEFSSFKILVEAELTEEHPMHYTAIMLNYQFEGTDLPPEKILKSIDLSLNRYCGVAATLKKALTIDFKLTINGK